MIRRMTKLLTIIAFLTNFSSVNARPVVVKIEDLGDSNWEEIEYEYPGFGSSGPVTLNWNPDNDFFTELVAYNYGYSGRAGAFCWYQEDCSLELSVSAENNKVILESFFLGYFGSEGDNVVYSILDLETETIIMSGAPWVGSDGAIIDVNASSNAGFRVLFGSDGVDAGINDITYSFNSTLVPIPAAVWLFGSGLIGLVSLSRTRRNRVY